MIAQYYLTNERYVCPTLRVERNTGIADPCYIIPNAKWSEFCAAFNNAMQNDANGVGRCVFLFEGVPFRVKTTNGDGCFQGVAVDAGIISEFPLDMALEAFKFNMIPADQ